MPLKVIVLPDPPCVNTGLAWRFTVNAGTLPSNWITKRSKPSSRETRMSVTRTVPVVPPVASAQVNAWVFSPGGVGGVIGAGEISGPVLPFVAGAWEIAAAGADAVLQAASTTTSAARAAARTGE